jgi:hypothetical protein
VVPISVTYLYKSERARETSHTFRSVGRLSRCCLEIATDNELNFQRFQKGHPYPHKYPVAPSSMQSEGQELNKILLFCIVRICLGRGNYMNRLPYFIYSLHLHIRTTCHGFRHACLAKYVQAYIHCLRQEHGHYTQLPANSIRQCIVSLGRAATCE